MNARADKIKEIDKIVIELKTSYPDINFVEGESFRWSPEAKTIFFRKSSSNALWSLLHEVGHMKAKHNEYSSDISLLRMEVVAWEEAKIAGENYGISISEEHIQKCLDSYRDWVYKRSLCPKCSQTGLERKPGIYSCINCPSTWKVSPARFCRPYRKAVVA